MHRPHLPSYASLGAVGMAMTCACSLFSGSLAPSAATQSPSSATSAAPSSTSERFRLAPNPQAVHVTLDTAHAVTNKSRSQPGVGNEDSLHANDANGNEINLGIPAGLLTQAADGTLEPAFGTAVTVTPVAAIPDIPFSKGFLAAFQMAPEGLSLVDPSTMELTIKGDFNSSDLVGFAADGNDANFHPFPIQAISGGGTTTVLFDISHFSLYGVAQASAAEVTAQLNRPPDSPGDQDDELLTAPQTKAQVKLAKEHDRWVKPTIDKLDQLSGNCNDVAVGALRFETWSKHVQSAGQQTYFKDTIDTDANVLRERLKDWLKTTCSDCINGGNKKPSKKAVDQRLTYSAFMQSLDLLQDNTTDANYWRQISNKSAQTAGRPLPEPAVAACENCTKDTPVPLTCPGP